MEGTPPTDEIIPSSDPEDMEPTNDLGDTHPTNDPEDSSKPQQNESSQSDATSESQTSEHSEAADEYEFNSDDHTNESSIEDTYNADESSDATDVNTDENCSVGEEITESLNDENDEMEDESSLVSRDGELSPAYDIIENTPVMLVEAQLPEIGDIAESQEINEPSKIISPASDILKADFAQGQPIMYKGLPGSGQIASQTPHIDQSHHCNYESAANLVQSPVSPLCTSPTCDCHLTNRSYFPDDFTDEKKPVGAPLKRPYDKIMAVTEDIHTRLCCNQLAAIDMDGWKLLSPQDSEDIRPRNRSELLRLLNELTTVLDSLYDKNCNDVNLEYYRRLACKLRIHLAPEKSTNYQPLCSCQTLSESCIGFVHGPPITLENIPCKYTERVLPPVIFQTFEMNPPWLRVHEEMIMKLRSKQMSCRFIKRPLTYAHITSQHVPAIQCLLGTYFWSNVDVSTVLEYPEFTCVVLYGKLVVGFGYLSPGTHRNEGYINFLFVRPHWRRCGIGETILYLLRQQCLFWTLTLHVSPNSEALNLYHKFGFKTYCRIKNFYADYVISNSQSEKDALFMKLESRIPQMF